MKRIFNNISIIVYLFAIIFTTSCQKDDEVNNSQSVYGYFQLKLSKDILSRGITSGAELEYLNDAKKISVDLLINNVQITQTLNLLSFDDESAEYGLVTETVQLMSGNYTLTGYKIHGKYAGGDASPILQAGEPDSEIGFTVERSKISVVDLEIEAKSRGKLSLIIDKDLTGIPSPMTRSSGLAEFDYTKIDKVVLKLQSGLNAPTDFEFKAWRSAGDNLFHTDTLTFISGEYKCTQMKLFNSSGRLLMVLNKDQTIKVEDQELKRDSVAIDMPLTNAIKDYIALYNIWKKMDGESWYWRGQSHPTGVNWLFEYSDGTVKDIDTWGNQPGVGLGENGRVTSLNLGGFNPAGDIPAEIGELTDLRNLILGLFNSGDGDFIDPDENIKTVDRYNLILQGVDIQKNRIEIAKEELGLKSRNNKTSLYKSNTSSIIESKYTSTLKSKNVNITNRITSIPEEIGKCVELSNIAIANGLISSLPNSIATMNNLTDLSIYNSPFEEIPEVVSQLKNLVAFMFAENKVDKIKLDTSLDRLFKGNSKTKIQILYLNQLGLTKLPASLSDLTTLSLFDAANNEIESIPTLGEDVSFVICLLDNNKITAIPDNWFNVDDIETLSITNNKLTVFPNMFDVNSVYIAKEVDFSGNQISSFSTGFKGVRIETLNLNNNRFTRFPGQFAKTGSEVRFLRVSNNEMEEILDEDIEGFKHLIALEAIGNKLDSIPQEFISETFPYLNAIDISFNQFKNFPYVILNVSTLATLVISNQIDDNGKRTLSEWPANIANHVTLRILEIYGNDIRNVDKFPLLINYLDIRDNPNIYLKVPQEIVARMNMGTIRFIFDEDQNVIPE